MTPLYQITNKDELLGVIRKAGRKEGIELSELLDSPSDINKYIQELIAENKMFIIKDMDGSQIIFYNELNIQKASPEVRELWSKVKVPDYQEVKRELKNAGLKSGNEEKKTKHIIENKKKVKRFNRKIKITNTHVKDLNLD
ncbi:transcription factor TFIIE beta subunit [Binucleata daphniae]